MTSYFSRYILFPDLSVDIKTRSDLLNNPDPRDLSGSGLVWLLSFKYQQQMAAHFILIIWKYVHCPFFLFGAGRVSSMKHGWIEAIIETFGQKSKEYYFWTTLFFWTYFRNNFLPLLEVVIFQGDSGGPMAVLRDNGRYVNIFVFFLQHVVFINNWTKNRLSA